MMRLGAAVLAVALLAAVAFLAAFFLQRKVLFPMPPLPHGELPQWVEAVRLTTTHGETHPLLLPSLAGGAGPGPLLVFAHGNGELADHWIDEFDPARAAGWTVLLLEYPGYGRSSGAPSEVSIRATADAAHEWAIREPRFDASRIVAYGRSLGGAVAAGFAADHDLPGLIVESAFTSVRPLAAQFLLPAALVRDPFDTLAALARYRGQLLVLHGRDDTIIPIAHGRALAAAVPGATFRELPCGHNDCPRDWATIEPFLARIARR